MVLQSILVDKIFKGTGLQKKSVYFKTSKFQDGDI